MRDIHWFLIRGLAREVRHWGEFPNILLKKSSRVTSLELPGFGKKNKEKSPLSIEELVEALRVEFLKKKSDAPQAICAISLGGMIAQAWIHKYPKDFSHAIIINSSSSKTSPLYHRITPSALGLVTKLFFDGDQEKRVRDILNKTTNIKEIEEKLLKKWQGYESEFPLSRLNFLKQLIAAAKFKIYDDLSIPTLFIASRKDRFVNPKCSKALADHYKKSFVMHPNAGHDLPLDDPSWLCSKMEEFINEN